jgi:hypothetical protein
MSKLRWAKWFWADWSNDTALNLCSIPARGLWMALLCLAAQGEPYGTVTIKGRVPSADELFSLICPRGTRRRDFNHWMEELETRGVAQRDHRLAIVSPRMSHEGVVANARIDAAHASWGNKGNGRNPRNLHEQTGSNGHGLHEQTGSFASIDSEYCTESPPFPPDGGERRARRVNGGGGGKKDSRNANVDLLAESLTNVETTDAHQRSAAVVPLTRRAVGS